jgi:hypothetical protein
MMLRQRVEDPIGTVDPLEILIDRRAEAAPREGMIRVAVQMNGDPILDGHLPSAGIGTIVRTAAADHARPLLLHLGSSAAGLMF